MLHLSRGQVDLWPLLEKPSRPATYHSRITALDDQ